MRKQAIAIMILLGLVYSVDKVLLFTVDVLPKSKPTPVELFMDRIGRIESGNNYRAVNQFGMLGRYQFNINTVRLLGFRVTADKFLHSPELQDSVMHTYMVANYRDLEPLIARYDGKVVHGVRITRAGILAAAHFAGSGGARSYLTSPTQGSMADGNGTTVSQYISQFSKFQLPALSL